MKILALGGWLYPIAKWLPNYVAHINAPTIGFTKSRCAGIAKSIDAPTLLIGFSEGANAAMEIALHSPMVRHVVVHSCEYKGVAFNYNCAYDFFYTRQDRTPTRAGTIRTFRSADSRLASIHELEYVPFEKPTIFEKRVLAPRFHIFHNVLPRLAWALNSRWS
jgi:hypothetical protein